MPVLDFDKLKVSRGDPERFFTGNAPHKPVLMPAVIKLFKEGRLD